MEIIIAYETVAQYLARGGEVRQVKITDEPANFCPKVKFSEITLLRFEGRRPTQYVN